MDLFIFANILLLGLGLGGVVRLLWAVREAPAGSAGSSLHAATELFLHTERPLFGAALPAAQEGLFTAALVLYEANVCLSSSLLAAKWPLLTTASDIADLVMMVLLGVCILGCGRYTGAELVGCGAVYFLFRWVFFNNHEIWVFTALLFCLAAKGLDLKKPMQGFLSVGLFCVGLVALLSLLGVVENIVWADMYRTRMYFGYSHPNTLGGLVLGLALGWVLLRGEALRWVDFLPLIAAALFEDLGPACRSAMVLLRFLIPVLAAVKLLPKKWFAARPVRLLLAAGPALMAALSYGLVWLFTNRPNPFLDWVNLAMTGRLYLAQTALDTLPFRIAGQPMPEYPPVDNCFIGGQLVLGPVANLLVWAAACVVLWQLLQKRRVLMAAAWECMLIFAFFEFQYFHLTSNPLLLLFAGVLFWEKSQAQPSV